MAIMLLLLRYPTCGESIGVAQITAHSREQAKAGLETLQEAVRRLIPGRLYLKVAGTGMFLLWLRVAAVLYAVASISALPAVLYNRPGWKKICVPAAVAAFFFHFVSLIEMLSAAHHSLPVGMHEVQSLLALLICAAFLLVALLYRTV